MCSAHVAPTPPFAPGPPLGLQAHHVQMKGDRVSQQLKQYFMVLSVRAVNFFNNRCGLYKMSICVKENVSMKYWCDYR